MKISEAVPNHLKDLYYPEQLTLWSIRIWSDGYRQNYSPYATLREAYQRAKCSNGLMALDNFLSLVISGNSRPVDIRCPCCGGISEDEWRMLQSIALVQAGREEKVSRLISHFLEPATVRVAQSVIANWAQELSDRSLQLQLRPRALQQVEPNYAVAEKRASFRVITNPSKVVLH
ncbi:hypothetical protein NBZ79_06235 [Sneathiella marina]|uniref:Uncharacterized protein n=1 Tax=Sneathiella marina TaxID=2950108 RepID=A0ABY4W6C6_9PROT|nr:hypothetical protein [Sneathiella marina]USG62572.1 hypothetical protein NBZ79_06235 [Sneathiella marina]